MNGSTVRSVYAYGTIRPSTLPAQKRKKIDIVFIIVYFASCSGAGDLQRVRVGGAEQRISIFHLRHGGTGRRHIPATGIYYTCIGSPVVTSR